VFVTPVAILDKKLRFWHDTCKNAIEKIACAWLCPLPLPGARNFERVCGVAEFDSVCMMVRL
jgi:hypothetical protein